LAVVIVVVAAAKRVLNLESTEAKEGIMI